MSNCGFTGLLPSSIGSLSALRSLDLSGNPFEGIMPASICSLKLDNFSTCNLSLPLADGNTWRCADVDYECATALNTYCGVGADCLNSCNNGLCNSSQLIWSLVCISIAIVIAAIIVTAVKLTQNRRKRKISEHRQNMTMMVSCLWVSESSACQLGFC